MKRSKLLAIAGFAILLGGCDCTPDIKCPEGQALNHRNGSYYLCPSGECKPDEHANDWHTHDGGTYDQWYCSAPPLSMQESTFIPVSGQDTITVPTPSPSPSAS